MPGRLLLVDTQRGEVINDEELKYSISTRRPVTKWLKEGLFTLQHLHNAYNKDKGLPEGHTLVSKENPLEISIHYDRRLPTFGYSVEDISMLVLPMIRNKYNIRILLLLACRPIIVDHSLLNCNYNFVFRKEAIGSMGNDTPLACLTMHPQLLFDYFKQLFAQVELVVNETPLTCLTCHLQ